MMLAKPFDAGQGQAPGVQSGPELVVVVLIEALVEAGSPSQPAMPSHSGGVVTGARQVLGERGELRAQCCRVVADAVGRWGASGHDGCERRKCEGCLRNGLHEDRTLSPHTIEVGGGFT